MAFSSNDMLLVHVAYLISFVSYQCLKMDSIAFQKGHFCSPLPLYMKGWGTLAPLCPSPLRRAWVVLLIVWHGNYTLTFIFIAWVNLVMEI